MKFVVPKNTPKKTQIPINKFQIPKKRLPSINSIGIWILDFASCSQLAILQMKCEVLFASFHSTEIIKNQ